MQAAVVSRFVDCPLFFPYSFPILSPMANYQVARALIGKGRNAGEGAAGLSKSSAKKGAKKPAVKKAEPKK
jgi:hypothetical protein